MRECESEIETDSKEKGREEKRREEKIVKKDSDSKEKRGRVARKVKRGVERVSYNSSWLRKWMETLI